MESDLNYDLFGGLAKDRNGQAITSFSRLLLRNSGNDCALSGFRDAYMQRVSAGLCVDTIASSAALVFINGEFWGVYNFRERYSPEYVSDHTGANKDTVVIIENQFSTTTAALPYVVSSGDADSADTFNWLVEYARTHDLSLTENFAYVDAQLDLDSLIDLAAVRLLFNALDWPGNNVKLWRNTNPNDPSGVDTKWHFVLLDMDYGMGMRQNTQPEKTVLLYSIFKTDCPLSNILAALMANQGFYERLLARLWSISDYLSADRLTEALEQMIAEREPLMGLQADRWPKSGQTVFDVNIWNEQVDIMRDFVNRRKELFRLNLKAYFKLSDEQFDALVASYYPAA